MKKTKSFNLAILPKEEMDKVNVDLTAAAVVYKERMNMPVRPSQVETEQPEDLRSYFRERLEHHRSAGKRLPRATDSIYQEMAESNRKKKGSLK